MAILTCPGCDRGGLRVPDGRRGKVTCPFCGAEWFHPPTVELSEVEFRCAKSGARFVLQMSRRSPLHKFVIQGIKDAPADPKHGFDSDTIHASGGLRLTFLQRNHATYWEGCSANQWGFLLAVQAPQTPLIRLCIQQQVRRSTTQPSIIGRASFAPTVMLRASLNAPADI